jgi:hypothetical protein
MPLLQAATYGRQQDPDFLSVIAGLAYSESTWLVSPVPYDSCFYDTNFRGTGQSRTCT